MVSSYERAYNERDKSESGGYAQEYLSYFVDDEPTPGIEYEYRLAQQVVPAVTLEDVSAIARTQLADDSRVLLAVSPQKPNLVLPSASDLQAVLASSEGGAVTPWTETAITRALMDHKPAPAAVSSRRELVDVGVTVVRFTN